MITVSCLENNCTMLPQHSDEESKTNFANQMLCFIGVRNKNMNISLLINIFWRCPQIVQIFLLPLGVI